MSGLDNDDVLHYSPDVKTLLTDKQKKNCLEGNGSLYNSSSSLRSCKYVQSIEGL